jgi:hypothetical protein
MLQENACLETAEGCIQIVTWDQHGGNVHSTTIQMVVVVLLAAAAVNVVPNCHEHKRKKGAHGINVHSI